MRLLLVEDDQTIADGLMRAMSKTGFAVDHVNNGGDADTTLSMQTYDVIVLDLGLPKLSGLEVLKRLRQRGNTTPVMILTAADRVEDRVKGLDLGADDYMIKPFALTELEARIRVLTRRTGGHTSAQITHGQLTYDTVGRVVYIREKMIDLSARELGLLEILLQRMGRLVSKEQLVEHLCEWGEEVSTNAIEVYMHRLRKKIEGSGVKVSTIRGLGYCLDKQLNEGDPSVTPSE
jgi:two-component system OmpR family response regulator